MEKSMLLHTSQPAWQGTQLPLLSTEPGMQREQIAFPLELKHVAQLVPQMAEMTQELLMSVSPTAQEVQALELFALQVMQILLHSWQTLSIVIAEPGKQLRH
jgi:hypothetical protein